MSDVLSSLGRAVRAQVKSGFHKAPERNFSQEPLLAEIVHGTIRFYNKRGNVGGNRIYFDSIFHTCYVHLESKH